VSVPATPFSVIYTLGAGVVPGDTQIAQAADVTTGYINQAFEAGFEMNTNTEFIQFVGAEIGSTVDGGPTEIVIHYQAAAVFDSASTEIPRSEIVDSGIRAGAFGAGKTALYEDLAEVLPADNPFTQTTDAVYCVTNVEAACPFSLDATDAPTAPGKRA